MAIRYIVNHDWQSSVSYSVSQSRRRKINRWHNWYGPSMHTTTIVSDTAIDQSDYWLLISRATHMIDCSIHVSVDWCIISLKINKSGSTQTQHTLPDITFTHLFWIWYISFLLQLSFLLTTSYLFEFFFSRKRTVLCLATSKHQVLVEMAVSVVYYYLQALTIQWFKLPYMAYKSLSKCLAQPPLA